MRVFHCDHCDHLVFFESVECVQCGHRLAFAPDLQVVTSLDPVKDTAVWSSPLKRAKGRRYKLCANYTTHNTCNWALPADDPNTLCQACRLTRIIPDLTVEGNKVGWYKLEVAKRRLIYTLMNLGLPLPAKSEQTPDGVAFEFLADPPPGSDAPAVLTGHADGVITVNIAEADDAEREHRKAALREPYRTLLGHFRHEIGHYYWNVLIEHDERRLAAFRKLFGDDRANYSDALQRHYESGPPADWQDNFISSYATMHAWEDWAETWAHYLHMVDTLETAADAGLSIRPDRSDEPTMKAAPDPINDSRVRFDKMMASWTALTYVLNNLNRGLGIPDAYPFVLSPAAVQKLKFVHDTIAAVGGG